MEVLYSIFVFYVLPVGILSFVLYFVMRAAVNSVLDEREIKQKKESQKEKEKEALGELPNEQFNVDLKGGDTNDDQKS